MIVEIIWYYYSDDKKICAKIEMLERLISQMRTNPTVIHRVPEPDDHFVDEWAGLLILTVDPKAVLEICDSYNTNVCKIGASEIGVAYQANHLVLLI